MNFKQLLYFCVVVRTGNYSLAAEECSVSQPVVYRAVKSLEEHCGIKLVERINNRVCVTSSGRTIYEYGEQIASLVSLADQAVTEEKGQMSGNISIGTSTTLGSSALPRVLAKWLKDNPRISVSITVGSAVEIARLLREDSIDVLLGFGEPGASSFKRELIFPDKLVVVSPADHPFVGRRSISIAELSNARLIIPYGGSTVRRQLDRIACQYGVQFKVVAEVNKHETIKHLCVAGIGIGFLPSLVIREELACNQLKVLDVEGFPRNYPFFAVYRMGKEHSPAVQSLVSEFRLLLVEGARPSVNSGASGSPDGVH